METRKPMSKFKQHRQEASKGPRAEMNAMNQPPDDEGMDDMGGESAQEAAETHGPAQEVNITHNHEAGKHHLHSKHKDGHEHHSDHASADEAHMHGAHAAGIMQEHQEPQEPDQDDYQSPEM